MAHFYLDTSALAKRYLVETGSAWVREITESASGNTIVVCDLTTVEFSSLLARRQREGEITPINATILQTRFLADMEREYLSLSIEAKIIERACRLVAEYPLRTLDAIQLASALEVAQFLDDSICFVAADVRLLNAAQSSGMLIENPYSHS
ncbi:MAG: type II toxin-antitoxin system VapC family toxin [Anaerolineae bacterium]|nr:type II toxin-antitoxin system VapC family toxin [Anaerolineae bacterium]